MPLLYNNVSASSASYSDMPAPLANYHNDLPPFHPDQMAVDDSSSRVSGFDPSLLNPMPPAQAPFQPSPFTPRQNGSPFNFPSMSMDPGDPFTAHAQGEPMSFTQMLAKMPTPPQPLPSRRTPTPRMRTPEPERVPTPTPVSVLESIVIQVECSPSPPLPDFHVDNGLVENLEQILRDRAQLEQLRLGNLWRHRSDWNRDNLVRELEGLVKGFIEEAVEDCDSEGEL